MGDARIASYAHTLNLSLLCMNHTAIIEDVEREKQDLIERWHYRSENYDKLSVWV